MIILAKYTIKNNGMMKILCKRSILSSEKNDAINNIKFDEESSIIKTKKKSILFIEIVNEYLKYNITIILYS